MTNKIKPFYIKGLSKQKQVEVVNRSVEAGAYPHETRCFSTSVCFTRRLACEYSHVGVNDRGNTYFTNEGITDYGEDAIEITLDQLESHLKGVSFTEEVSIKVPEYTPFEELSVGDLVVVVEQATHGEVEVGHEDVVTGKYGQHGLQVGEADANWFYGRCGGKLLKLDSSPKVSNKEDTVPAINIISEEVTTLLDSVCLCIQYTKGEYKVYGDYLEEGVVIKSVDDIKKLVEAITTIAEFTKGK